MELEKVYVRNPSVSLSPTLTRNEKVEHYIRIKTHKPIALRFWVESGVSLLCGYSQISLVLFSLVKPPLLKPDKWYQSRWLIPAQTSAVLVWS